MLTALIKYLFIYITCIRLYYVSLPTFNISIIKEWLLAFILSITTCLIDLHSTELCYLFPLLVFWIVTSFLNSSPQQSFITLTISFTISLSLCAIFSFIIVLIITPIFDANTHFPIIALSTGILQLISIKQLLKLKRFKNGISFLFSSAPINLLTLLCLLFITISVHFIRINAVPHLRFAWFISFIPYLLTLAFLIYWWQAQITKAYRRSLELRELESMRTEMAELKIKMQELTDENERLARITHRDNTLISALKNSTVKYLSTDFANPAVALETRNQLIENINALSAGRSSLAEARKEQSARTFETGFSLLNTLLHEMDEKALETNIAFAVHMGISLDDFVPGSVSEDDLVHTIDDLLKNAFKATTTCEKRMVQLQFYKLGKHLVVEVADNGIPFEVKSLVNMGMEKLTTYEDGSGIGLVDIWSTKEKYGATYHLDECVNASPFTKKISLTFDKKNRYSIRTLRKEEILQASRRAYLQVYDYNE